MHGPVGRGIKMKTIRRTWVAGLLGLTLLLPARARSAETPTVAPAELIQAAVETYHAAARQRGTKPLATGTAIAKKHWAPLIVSFKPKKVYTHGANLVIVGEVKGKQERGLYVHLPFSTTLPHSGTDGFSLRPDPGAGGRYNLGTGVFEFERTPQETAKKR